MIPSASVIAQAVIPEANRLLVTPSDKLPNAWKTTTVGGGDYPRGGMVTVPTAAKPLRPIISWPGVVSPVSLNYVVSHGISPGRAVLTINPQKNPPAVNGNLVFGDGIRPPIVLRDCHLDHTEAVQTGSGYHIQLHISDRRWRWQQGYDIYGEYNRLDPNNNFIPWTVRSATELAQLCLRKMNEKRYTIAFPPGLTKKQSQRYDRVLRAGERYPLTYANPYVHWDHIPAAVALQRLADVFGCHVIFDPVTDRVAVLPLGYGNGLPYAGASIASASQGVQTTRLPKYVGVMGAPMKFQMRIALEAVGEEWDGYYTRINDLSYTPVISYATPEREQRRGWDYSPPPDFPNVEPTERLEYTEAKEFAQRSIYRAYRIRQYLSDDNIVLFNAPLNAFGRYLEGIDVSGKPKIVVPGLRYWPADDPEWTVEEWNNRKTLQRWQQIILTPYKVEQNKPRPRRDTDIVREPNRPYAADDPGSLPDYYNGFSRDRPAECFGTYYIGCSTVWYDVDKDVVEKRRVYLPFSINATEGIVYFSEPLYTLIGTGTERRFSPVRDLYIETGVYIIDADTNAVVRPKYTLYLGGTAPPVWEIHEDIVTHVVGLYNDDNTLTEQAYELHDFGDGYARASYYLAGMRRRFRNWQSQVITYNGCMLIPPTGTIQQIQWQVGDTGIHTTASANSEFHPNIPPYPARKLKENLPPDIAQRLYNVVSSPYTPVAIKENIMGAAIR